MIDSNMVVYIVVCAVMLLVIVMVFFDDIKTTSALMKANTRIDELEKTIEKKNAEIHDLDCKAKNVMRQRDFALAERNEANQMCDRLRKENDRLKSIRPVGESVLVPLDKVTFGYDDDTLKVSFSIPDVIPGVNDEYTAELVGVLMSKRIVVGKAKEEEQ